MPRVGVGIVADALGELLNEGVVGVRLHFVAYVHTYRMVQRQQKPEVLVHIVHVLVVSKVCLTHPWVVLWDHKIVSLEVF